jgi:hypothetical protein
LEAQTTKGLAQVAQQSLKPARPLASIPTRNAPPLERAVKLLGFFPMN